MSSYDYEADKEFTSSNLTASSSFSSLKRSLDSASPLPHQGENSTTNRNGYRNPSYDSHRSISGHGRGLPGRAQEQRVERRRSRTPQPNDDTRNSRNSTFRGGQWPNPQPQGDERPSKRPQTAIFRRGRGGARMTTSSARSRANQHIPSRFVHSFPFKVMDEILELTPQEQLDENRRHAALGTWFKPSKPPPLPKGHVEIPMYTPKDDDIPRKRKKKRKAAFDPKKFDPLAVNAVNNPFHLGQPHKSSEGVTVRKSAGNTLPRGVRRGPGAAGPSSAGATERFRGQKARGISLVETPQNMMATSSSSESDTSEASNNTIRDRQIQGRRKGRKTVKKQKPVFSDSSSEDEEMRPRSSVHPPDRGASDPGSPQPVHNSLLEARPYDDAEGIEYCLPVRDGALAIPRQSKPNATKTPAYFTRRKPPTELISAFEMLTLESASLPHINSTRNPSAPLFLTRNARSGFESLMRRKRRVSSSLSEEGLNRPEPVIRQFPSEDTLRINLILVGTPFSRAPDSVVASFQLEFRSKATGALESPLRLELGRRRVKLIPSPHDSGNQMHPSHVWSFSTCPSVTSEPICFPLDVPATHIPEGQLIITLYHFRSRRDKPVTWCIREDQLQGPNKAEAKLPMLFKGLKLVPPGRHRIGVQWIRNVRDHRPEVVHDETSWVEIEVDWTSERCFRKPQPSYQPSQLSIPPVVGVEYRVKAPAQSGDEVAKTVLRWRTQQHGYRCPLCTVFGVFSSVDFLAMHCGMHHRDVMVRIKQEDYQLFIEVTLTMKHPFASPRQQEKSASQDSDSGFETTKGMSRSRQGRTRERSHSSDQSYYTGFESTPAYQTPPPLSTFVPALTATPAVATAAGHSRTEAPVPFVKSEDTQVSLNLSRSQHYGDQQPLAAEFHHPSDPSRLRLLDDLPLDHLGNQRNRVISRESEIWDLQEVSEECRIIAVLWSRWIILNRSAFLGNYYGGVVSFIGTYYEYMHRLAGWKALRGWLLMLVSWRYLSMQDVPRLLQLYNGLVQNL